MVEASRFAQTFRSDNSASASSSFCRIGRLIGPPSYLPGENLVLHNALRYVRKFHRMSVNEVAAEVNLSPSYISEIENGKKRIHQDILQAYGNVFNMPISSFHLIAESIETSNGSRKRAIRRKISKIIEWIAED
ncbi:MAG: helix-turn-helix transcriptional regulator [Rhodospirillaceae bacterium]|nr:helix-turn-helix transcriptional regulator [Rhodospirillaceae bacterium]